MVVKRFFDWILVKEKLSQNGSRAPFVSEGDIWWASIGENVGYEINGKNDLFSRPVIIYKKLTSRFYFVIPTTSVKRAGSWFFNFSQQKKEMSACLHQSRPIDYRRLSSKIGALNEEDFKRLKEGVRDLYL